MSKLQLSNPLLNPINHLGKQWITSKKFFEDFKPLGRLSETNRAIREMPAYGKLCEDQHLLEVNYNYVKSIGGADLASLIELNSYQPILLIDPVAQKEIEHRFNVTTDQAVKSSRENAVLGLAGINLELIAQDPILLALLQTISQAKELESRQKKLENDLLEQRLQFLELKSEHENLLLGLGDGQFYSVRAYAAMHKLQINLQEAQAIGRLASTLCREHRINPGTVADPRYGKVNVYPKQVLDQAFEILVLPPKLV